MEEPGAPLSVATDVVPITLELVADEGEGDAALINAVGRDTAAELQQNGFTLRPIYTGQRGGPFIVEVLQAVEQVAGQVWANHAAIEEGFNDIAILVTIFTPVATIIKRLRHAHEQQVGKDESQTHPIKVTVDIDEAHLTVEAADTSQAEAALAMAWQLIIAHPTVAARVTHRSRMKVRGRVPRKPRRRRK